MDELGLEVDPGGWVGIRGRGMQGSQSQIIVYTYFDVETALPETTRKGNNFLLGRAVWK